MRIVIYGIGAVGGVVAGALAASGQEVLGIARGEQFRAIRDNGLILHTHAGSLTTRFPVTDDPREVDWRTDDVVILCVKGQHTADCLSALQAAGLHDQHIFCAQNGIANERAAAKLFPNVHGITVILPGTYLTPGEVIASGHPNYGIFDIGRYPEGSDAQDDALAKILNDAKIASFVLPDVMASKRGKLVMNMGNILDAALGPGADMGDLRDRARSEATAAFDAAGLTWQTVDENDPRRDVLMKTDNIPGFARSGSSTTQSLLRGTGTLETRWLNGEIVDLAKAYGLSAPVNEGLVELADQLERDGSKPGAVTLEQVRALIAS